jgi:hypothetical protein
LDFVHYKKDAAKFHIQRCAFLGRENLYILYEYLKYKDQ